MRNDDWKEDKEPKANLEAFVKQNLQRVKILDFVHMRYPMYAWSFRTLCQRMQHFSIKYIDYDIEVHDTEDAVWEEIAGPGRLFGYCASHKKVREIHGLNVTRGDVYAMMADVDPSGQEERGDVGEAARLLRTGNFTSQVIK